MTSLFNVVVCFSCGSCSDFSFVLKQRFPVLVQRSQLSLSNLAAQYAGTGFFFYSGKYFLPKVLSEILSIVVLKIKTVIEIKDTDI